MKAAEVAEHTEFLRETLRGHSLPLAAAVNVRTIAEQQRYMTALETIIKDMREALETHSILSNGLPLQLWRLYEDALQAEEHQMYVDSYCPHCEGACRCVDGGE